MPEKKTTPETKNVDVAWDKFASVRHDENALDIAETYGLAAADVYLDDIEGLEDTLTRHPEIGRLCHHERHPKRRVHTSARRWSLVFDYNQPPS